jgi:hypothetical protein
VIAVLGIVVYIVAFVAMESMKVLWNIGSYKFSSSVFNFLAICFGSSIYWCILMAQRKRVARLYWPYLVLNVGFRLNNGTL